jgi:hypothetical protein
MHLASYGRWLRHFEWWHSDDKRSFGHIENDFLYHNVKKYQSVNFISPSQWSNTFIPHKNILFIWIPFSRCSRRSSRKVIESLINSRWALEKFSKLRHGEKIKCAALLGGREESFCKWDLTNLVMLIGGNELEALLLSWCFFAEASRVGRSSGGKEKSCGLLVV